MPPNPDYSNDLDRSQFVTRAEAMRILHISRMAIDRVIAGNSVPVWKVPGHSKVLLNKKAVLRLAQQAVSEGGRS